MDNKKILVVEDDPNFGSILKDYLTLNEYDIVLAKNGIEGYEKFKKEIILLGFMKNVELPENIKQYIHNQYLAEELELEANANS